MSVARGRPENICSKRAFLRLCRVADAGHSDASTRANSRRRQLAKGRNRGRWGAEGATGRYGDLSTRDVMMVVDPDPRAGCRAMPRVPIRAAEQPGRAPKIAI